ncbi:MAG: TlpA family protein disulfide reductase [Pseudomonadota bacterium]|nr:TlpA family protein disulfide reductase [Pseudomonadota bacterium]
MAALPAAADELVVSPPKPAPAISFKDDAGNVHALDPKAAKLTAVHFWATWCVPCVAELPQVDAAQQAYGRKSFKVIALSLDGTGKMDNVKTFFSNHQITHLTPYLDNAMASFRAAGLHGMPATIFIDGSGNEVARSEGAFDWKGKVVTDFIEKQLQ